MSEQNKTTVRQIIDEVWCNGNTNNLDNWFSPNMTNNALPPGTPPGIEGTRTFAKNWNAAFPNTNIEITNQWTDGDCVCTCWTANTCHEGNWNGYSPTNNDCTFTGITVYRFDNTGKVTEVWGQFDHWALMTQIGATTPMTTPAATPTS